MWHGVIFLILSTDFVVGKGTFGRLFVTDSCRLPLKQSQITRMLHYAFFTHLHHSKKYLDFCMNSMLCSVHVAWGDFLNSLNWLCRGKSYIWETFCNGLLSFTPKTVPIYTNVTLCDFSAPASVKKIFRFVHEFYAMFGSCGMGWFS